jgi:excisionase family DNA binding protein
MMPNAEDLTVAEVCERTRLDPETVQRALRTGDLRGYKVLSRWRVRPVDLADWCPPNAPPPRKGRRKRQARSEAADRERTDRELAALGYR